MAKIDCWDGRVWTGTVRKVMNRICSKYFWFLFVLLFLNFRGARQCFKNVMLHSWDFWEFDLPPYMAGAQKIFQSQMRFQTYPNDFLRFFDFQHWKWHYLKMLKMFETRFEIWCPKIAIGVLRSHLFVFEKFVGRLRC